MAWCVPTQRLMLDPRRSLRASSSQAALRACSLVCLGHALLAQGCADECTEGEQRCNGNSVQRCEVGPGCGEELFGGGCTATWHPPVPCSLPGEARAPEPLFSAPMPPVCVVAEPTADGSRPLRVAVCAQSSKPDPSCEGKFGFCGTENAVACNAGFVVGSTPCAPPKVCSGEGECRDPRCEARVGQRSGAICDGATLLQCQGAFSTDTNCPAVCVTTDGTAFCALAADPDPRCVGVDAYCDGNMVVNCSHGFATMRITCASGSTCAPSPPQAPPNPSIRGVGCR